MPNLKRLYLSCLINTFGSWLTFIAIALVVQENYGSHHTPFVFLMQTLPAIFLSRGLVRLIPPSRHESTYLVAQVLLAVSSLILVFDQGLTTIYCHLLLTATLRSVSGPLFNSLVGKWAGENQTTVFTRIGSIQAGTLAFAPIAGAWIKTVTSSEVLFAVDALSFIASIVLLKELFKRQSHSSPWKFRWREAFSELAPLPTGIPSTVWRVLCCWFAFLAVGALLNSLEFRAFEIRNLSETEIGYALASWGAGNCIAFALPLTIPPAMSALGYVLALTGFVVGDSKAWIWIAFLIAGALSSYFAGQIRSTIQKSTSDAQQAVGLWAYAHQITQIINLVAYACAGLFLTSLGFNTFASIMLGLGVIFVGIAFTLRVQKEV